MDVIVLANGPFAQPALRQLAASRHRILLVAARPDRPQGKKLQILPGPIATAARELSLPLEQPEDANSESFVHRLTSLKADVLVVADFGQILSTSALASARLGGINIHASLLPKYRGAAPVAWAIYHGEEATGVSIIRMTPRLDAGGIILQESLAIAIDETAGELEARLATLGARMTLEALDQLEAGTARVLVQDDAKATKAPRLKKEDGAIDWTRSSRAIHDQVRALRPWPCAFTDWHRTGDTSTRLQILATRPVDATAHAVSGRRVGDDPHRLTIACGTGVLEILELKPAGKREMDAAEFLRGNRWQPDDYLGADGRQAVP